MTTSAEELKPRHEVMDAAIRYASSSVNRAIDGGSAYSFISHQVGLRDALIASQAAEIAALKTSRASIDQMRERNAALEAELDKVAKIVDVFKKIAGRV